jgi:DNA polymerase III subunit delta'
MPFTGIMGHDNSIALLNRTLASGNIANSYLFEGIEGCGKKMAAIAFVEAVFCGGSEACGSCPSCRKIAAMQHPDLHLVEADGAFIKIDQIRELQRELSLRPFEAQKKACIIDGAERLNPAAGNALLKTLEEPPGNALMILITANPDGVLPTVLSRCQRLHFAALPESAIETLLRERGKEPEAARIAASLASGSMARALKIGEESAMQGRKSFLERVASLSLGEITPLFNFAEELAGDKENALESLVLLTSFLRDALLVRSNACGVVNTDLLPLVEQQAARFSGDDIMERIRHVAGTRRAIAGNVNARLALEVLFMKLAENQ